MNQIPTGLDGLTHAEIPPTEAEIPNASALP
jgi:hypothetical protein